MYLDKDVCGQREIWAKRLEDKGIWTDTSGKRCMWTQRYLDKGVCGQRKVWTKRSLENEVHRQRGIWTGGYLKYG